MMSAGEWLNMLRDLGLLEMGLVNIQTGLQAFQWSRIRTLENYSNRSEIKIRSVYFEDFLEAFVRIATMVAMPTREELDQSRVNNAAEFLHALRNDVPDAYHVYVQRRTLSWQELPHQRTHVLLASLLDLVVANVAAGLAQVKLHKTHVGCSKQHDSHDGKALPHPSRQLVRSISSLHTHGVCHEKKTRFTAAELHIFREHRCHYGELLTATCRISGVPGSEILFAIQRTEVHIMDALRDVPAFEDLTEDQLVALRNAMTFAKFYDGEAVFRQGEEGDSFYLITTGRCEVRRVDSDTLKTGVEEERLLCRLQQSDCFGERALLFDEPRAASVYAGPGCNLYVVFIARTDFEATLGQPLSEFQKLKHVAAPGEAAAPEDVEKAS